MDEPQPLSCSRSADPTVANTPPTWPVCRRPLEPHGRETRRRRRTFTLTPSPSCPASPRSLPGFPAFDVEVLLPLPPMYAAGQGSKGRSDTEHAGLPTIRPSPATAPPTTAQDYFFIPFVAERKQARTKLEDKNIRAQAARASWSQRHDRKPPRKPKLGRRKSTAKRGSARDASPLSENGLASPESLDGRLSRAHSAPADAILRDVFALSAVQVRPESWVCDLSGLVRGYFVKAVSALEQRQIVCNVPQLLQPFGSQDFYYSPLILQCLTLLAITASCEGSAQHFLTRSIIIWTRQQLIVSIQANLQSIQDHDLALAVALLAGWELEHGEAHASELHLTALSSLVGLQEDYQPPTPYEVSIPPITEQHNHSRLPPGFDHYRSNLLLPSSLMNLAGSLKHLNPDNPDDMFDISKIGAAVLASRASAALVLPMEDKPLWERVALHVRLAAGLLSVMMHLDSNDEPSHRLTKEMLQAWYPETLTLTLPPSHVLEQQPQYREILLWALCVFCACVERPVDGQVEAVIRLLEELEIREWADLKMVLDRYLRPKSLSDRLWPVLMGVFAKSPGG